jgi:hypothetical protein
MQFTRHAKNRLRLYKLTREQAEAAVASGNRAGTDPDGRPLYTAGGVTVVVALDKPNLIVTLYPED